MLTLFCLGALRLERDGTPLLTGRRKPLALLAFLARRGERPSAREELAALLWSSDDASARKSLRQCLSELRAVEGLAFAESEAGVFIPPGTLATDVGMFEEDTRAGRWGPALDRWRGEFIAGGESLGDDVWQAWLDGERAALRRQLAMACDRITATAEEGGEWREVIRATERWRSVLPDDGRAWAREIHALQASGRLAEAIARVAEAEHHFRKELGVRLPDEVARLGRVLARVGQFAGSAAAALLSPDMVGRGETLATMARARVQLMTARESRSRTLLIAAGEGRGKTRVLREFSRQAREGDTGLMVIEASAHSIDRERSLSLLQDVLTPIVSHDALAGCPPETLATLAHVSPALREHFRHIPSIDAPGPNDVAAAFSRALAEVARESPIVLVLDDLPDGDRESLGVLIPLVNRAPAHTLIVAAGRPESWQRSAALSDLLYHADSSDRLALEPLRRDETRALLASMAPLAAATLEILTDSLHELSGGVPGLLTSLMTHQVTAGRLVRGETGEWSLGLAATLPGTIPPDLEDRWQSRYRLMSSDAQRVVDSMAVLGSGGDPRTAEVSDLENVARLDSNRFRAALDSLRATGVLQRTEGTVAFVAEAQRVLAYGAMTPSTRLRLHENAARRLRASSRWPSTRARVEYHRRASTSARQRPAASIVLVGAVIAAAAWYGATRNTANVTVGAPMLLADVVNLTGDSAFDRTLFLAASIGLQQSRQVSLFPRSRVRETLALMRRPGADSVLDETLAREIAVRENLQRILLLAVARVESLYVVTARIIHPASGRDLFADQERAATRAGVLEGLDRLLTRVRRASGEPVDSVRDYSVPLPRVTTGSLVALQAYAGGVNAWANGRYQEAIAAFRRAVQLDSAFALAWLGLAEASYQVGSDRPAGDTALAQALRFADRLTERERLRLELAAVGYRGLVDQQLRIAEQLARRFPERDTWYSLGTHLMRMRRCPEAISALGRSLTFDSAFARAHINVATCYQFLGASDSAVDAYARAYAADSLSVYSGGLNHEFGVALVRAGLLDSARRVYTRMANRPRLFDRQFGQRSLGYLAGWLGQYHEAEAHFDTAAGIAVEMGQPMSEFRNRVLRSEYLLTMGSTARAGRALDAAWALIPRLTLEPAFALYAGLAHVRAGQIQRASILLDRIAAVSREASGDDRTTHAVLAARIALARGNAREARAALLAATDTTRSDYILATLVEVSVALGHPDSALHAATRLASRATFGTDAQDSWMRSLLQKAKISERLGRLDEARTDYARLEAQWSSGDRDHPVRLEAQRGIARLAGADARKELPVRPPRP